MKTSESQIRLENAAARAKAIAKGENRVWLFCPRCKFDCSKDAAEEQAACTDCGCLLLPAPENSAEEKGLAEAEAEAEKAEAAAAARAREAWSEATLRANLEVLALAKRAGDLKVNLLCPGCQHWERCEVSAAGRGCSECGGKLLP